MADKNAVKDLLSKTLKAVDSMNEPNLKDCSLMFMVVLVTRKDLCQLLIHRQVLAARNEILYTRKRARLLLENSSV